MIYFNVFSCYFLNGFTLVSMKTILLISLLLILSACCLEKTTAEPKKDADEFVLKQRTIQVNFHPLNSIRYKDYLIIQGEDDQEAFCFEVYDLKTGKTDTAFYRQIAMDSIYGFIIRNEQLMARSVTNQWKVWDKNGWQIAQSYSDFFFAQVMKDGRPQNLKFLHEDATYFVYGVNLGEWGGGAFFYHKRSGKTYSFQKNDPVDVLKSKEGYELSVSMPHGSGFVSIVTIHDPLKLELVPDKLSFLKHEFGEITSQQVYDFWKLNEQRNLPFALFFRQFTSKETDESEFRFAAHEYYNSLLKNDPNIDFKLDTIGMDKAFLCYGSFDFKSKTTYLIQDSILYLVQMEKGKLARIQAFPEQKELPYYTSMIEHKKGRNSYSLWSSKGYNDHELMVRHVWLSVSGTTIYRYNIVHMD
ncbi:MAG: hypothetical protein A3D31_00800 [Candidatus Fluviicola riflensis]|nr:MAG: hypothetical protein CHH17_04740 [Candidatus Fluviicola riflensis]OGS76146.1 MAG: hypothetical protein A3D31_00800 [Candidatus Fluviicola riflensis]OGS83310.1 MAG: hypothetical protein A2724_01040 [Fluviicola sp. RIFCSPHIGHO2_01_FULL_43_53]OGS83678.1 MAG: hypothetical protein A3E30_17405 [Fluviicola sp. RIFCSPHIGHO2_12_FULL_43_24]